MTTTTTRDKQAYNERRATLARKGIDIPDRYGQGDVSDASSWSDAEPGDEAMRRDDPKAYAAMMQDRADVGALERDVADRGDPLADSVDSDWMWREGRPH